MRSSIRRSTPAIGEASHGSRAACTATRCEKSAFSSMDSLVRRFATISLVEEQYRGRCREIQPCEPGVIGTKRFTEIQPDPRLVQKELPGRARQLQRPAIEPCQIGRLRQPHRYAC